MHGYILINKEKDMTSRDVVNIASKVFKTKKVGHTGTLDPLATGVLVICVGQATKLVEVVTSNSKEYIATICLGLDTDTLDITGKVLNEENCTLSKDDIVKVLNSFKKTYNQEVPAYSAVKVKGKKCYEYARAGIEVELPKKEVTIYNIDLIDEPTYKDNKTYFKIKTNVSKGTYIRSLIRDIALELNTVGTMVDLVRTKQGKFLLENCDTLEDLKNGKVKLRPMIDLVGDIEIKSIDDNVKKDILNGKLLENKNNCEEIAFVDKNSNLISIYKKYEKDNKFIKPWKTFVY